MNDFFYLLRAFFFASCAIALVILIIYFCCSSCEDSHVSTENEPSLYIHLEDIEYKGHTYIMLRSCYGKALLHAEHCRCHLVKK